MMLEKGSAVSDWNRKMISDQKISHKKQDISLKKKAREKPPDRHCCTNSRSLPKCTKKN
jgi:hypothetical protein